MRVLTADRRIVSVPMPGASAASSLAGSSYPSATGYSMPLVDGPGGIRRSVRFAEVARVNPWVRWAINRRAGVASRVPLHVFRPDPEATRPGARVRVRPGDGGDGSGLAQLLASPEPRVSARKWKRWIYGDVLVHGAALAEYLFSGSQIIGLRWQPWVDVTPHLSDDGLRIESLEVPVERTTRWGQRIRMSGQETRHIDVSAALLVTFGDDTESPLGVSPLESLKATHALHDAAMRFAVSYMREGVFPAGMVELPAQASIEQAKVTRELIEQLYAGPDQAGKPLAGFGKWHQISATPEGAKLVELARYSREEVTAAYDVHLSMIESGGSNKATTEAARRMFVRDVVGGDVALLETEIQAQLVDSSRRWSQANLTVEAQLAEQLRPDAVELSQVIQREVGGPVVVANEARRWLGLPPLDDPRADELILNPGTPEAPEPGNDDGDEV